MTDSPDVAAAMALLDTAKDSGFAFQRIAPGPDGPRLGVRETEQWRDEIYLGGFWATDSCGATRRRRSSLVLPGGLPVARELRGDALTVLHTVLCDWGCAMRRFAVFPAQPGGIGGVFLGLMAYLEPKGDQGQ
ncbi:MAG: hypothetical protein ACRDQU_07090 [Pseudonocardiaceae bacterium]